MIYDVLIILSEEYLLKKFRTDESAADKGDLSFPRINITRCLKCKHTEYNTYIFKKRFFIYLQALNRDRHPC